MGRSTPLRKPSAKPATDKPAAEFRARIYQQILSLLDMTEKLSLDLFRQEDPYGLDWHGLARQVVSLYKTDVVQAIQALREMVMSKDGARRLPKVLYRNLLDYLEAGAVFTEGARGGGFEAAAASLSPRMTAEERAGNLFLRACDRFRKATLDLQQHICIFENERPTGEESFFA